MLFSRSYVESGRASFGIVRFLPLLSLLAVLTGLLLVAGCGGGADDDKDNLILAIVGEKEITGNYYESKLSKLEKKELPRGEDGLLLDMAQMPGKTEFLQTIINKEVMAQKAVQLGYGDDPQVVQLRKSMTSYEAGLALWDNVIGYPSSTVTPKQLEDFHARMGEIRDCSYVITNFLEDAEAARKMARDGADWDAVVDKYHDGVAPPKGKYEISIPYGRYNTDFDTDVFDTPVGDVSPPIKTNFGFWVLKVNEIKDMGKPDLEEAKAQILDVARNRMIGTLRKEFIEEVRESYGLFINEDVLWTCFKGLPENEVILDPATNKQTPKDQLKPLAIDPADMDRIFYGYRMDGDLKEYTLGEYKTIYDRMSVFQRPKAGEMLGGLREKISANLEKALMNKEAEKRGFFEDPQVVAAVQAKAEEVMVTKLYDEVVTFDDSVGPDLVQEFWKEHESDYFLPESRSGRLVVCLNEESAIEARESIESGMKWRDILVRYGTDKENKSRSGKIDNAYKRASGPVPEALFTLSVGETSEPIPVDNDRFLVIKLVNVEPGRQQELKEINEAVGQRIKGIRREEAFQTLLDEWSEELGVTRFEERLAEVASWEELTAVEMLGEAVPRN
ncbi:MAG: peptidyl-prolyl cis-trans isomerase [Gemmatimonadales bacterium]|nr:peptidyl-prolyl cis-trans isomerase [Gemmatimonadales bacterium]